MTWRPPIMKPDDRVRLERNRALRFSDSLAPKGYVGPAMSILYADPAIRSVMMPGLTLSEGNDDKASAIGSLNTMWVFDPNDEDFGIWGANVIADADVRNAQKGGFPFVSGFYYRVATKLPPPEVMRDRWATLIWGEGAKKAYDGFYAKKDGSDDLIIKPVERPTLELTVLEEGEGQTIVAAKTAEESIKDEAHPGVALAGPGAWKKFVGDKTPKDFGLPKPILALQEDTGKVTPAVEEYETVREAAKQGDAGAQEALRHLGLSWA